MKPTLTLLCLFFSVTLYAQKLEFLVQANSGLYHYSGKSATSVSSMNVGLTPDQNYTNNPHGTKNGFSYGADVAAQLVSKHGLIAGLQLGYEILRSRVDINSTSPVSCPTCAITTNYIYYYPTSTPATGHSILQNEMINFNPYLGYRLKFKKVSLDLLPGIDVGINVSSRDKGKAIGNAQVYYLAQGNINTSYESANTYTANKKLPDAPTDVRLRLGLAATYRKFGVTASYAHGLTNLDKNITGDDSYEVHSELIRFGISYKLH